jgi:hypothetical protein
MDLTLVVADLVDDVPGPVLHLHLVERCDTLVLKRDTGTGLKRKVRGETKDEPWQGEAKTRKLQIETKYTQSQLILKHY